MSSLTAVANKSLNMSRSLTEKIAADADDSDDDDDDDDARAVVNTPSHSSNDKQVVQLSDSFTHSTVLELIFHIMIVQSAMFGKQNWISCEGSTERGVNCEVTKAPRPLADLWEANLVVAP